MSNNIFEYFKIHWTDDLKRGLYLAGGALLIAAILLSGLFVELKPLAGDEPHYLVVTNSILTDGDLDLHDDYNVEQSWKLFYNGELGPHYAPGLSGKHSTRAIGLSYYLLPFYAVGTVTGAVAFWTRFAMAILFSLFLMQLYLLLRDLKIGVTPALWAVILSALTIPLLFYSYSIFPEIPTALLTIVAVRLMLRWDQRTLLNPLLAGAALALLPWLGVKYAVISVVFGLGIIVQIVTSRAPLFRSLSYFMLVPVVSLAGLLLFLWLLYGSFSPEVIYTGVGEGAKTTGGFNMQAYGEQAGNKLGSFFRVLLLYLFDQRDGILFYSPFYLLGITGLLIMQGRKPFSHTLLIGFAAYWAAYATSAWYSGYAPSGRPLVAVLWILVAGFAYVLTRINRRTIRLIVIATVAFSLAFGMLHLSENHLMYHVIDAATQEHGNNLLTSIASPFDMSMLFPNLVSPHDIHPIPVIIFITLSIALGILVWRSFNAPEPKKDKEASSLFVISALLAAGLPVLFVLILSQGAIFVAPEDMQGEGGLRLVFRDENTYGYEPVQYQGETYHGFWQRGGSTAEVFAVSGIFPEQFRLLVHSAVPQTVRLQAVSQIVELEFEQPGWKEVLLPGETALRWTNRALLPIRIATETGFRPSDKGGSSDTRFLGARIAVDSIP